MGPGGNGTTIDAGTSHNIVLNGALLAANNLRGHGLVIAANDCEVRGLVIIGFPNYTSDSDDIGGSGIFIDGTFGGGDNNRLYNNWIGIGADGNTATGNGRFGVLIGFDADNNVVGGTGANQRNVITAGGVANVNIGDTGTATNDNNRIIGNFIGTNADGTAKPSGINTNSVQAGINIAPGAIGTIITDNLVGGLTHQGAAVNDQIAGIFISGFGSSTGSPRVPRGTVIQRNLIGVNSAGTPIPTASAS
jgi:hypothetical protein